MHNKDSGLVEDWSAISIIVLLATSLEEDAMSRIDHHGENKRTFLANTAEIGLLEIMVDGRRLEHVDCCVF